MEWHCTSQINVCPTIQKGNSMNRRILSLLCAFLLLPAYGCAAFQTAKNAEPVAKPTATAGAEDPLAAIQNAETTEEAASCYKAALEAGDYETALACAKRMVEIDPSSQEAQNALAEAQVALLGRQVDGLNASIESSLASVADPAAYAEYVSRLLEGVDLTVSLPFVSDYGAAENANTSGISFANLVQRGVYKGWQGGLLTAQADWIYFSAPGENWAVYKIREGGGTMIRLGEACGCYLNAVGDWLYYCNTNDENKIYKMRTDGSENTKVSDDTGLYLAVIDGWMYYAAEAENDNLYRARPDGSERTMLSGEPTREAYCADGALYTALRDEAGIYRANPDASNSERISTRGAGFYFAYDGWIYLVAEDHGLVILRIQPDGTGEEELLRADVNIAAFTLANGKLIVTGRLGKDQQEGITVFDLATMEQIAFCACWCEGLYTANGSLVYFIDCENNAWNWLNPETGETGALN